MPSVFISYRRSDSAGYAGRLSDLLADRFGERNVFRDLDSLGPGTEFAKRIKDAIARSDAVVVVIGPSWLSALHDRSERAPDDVDYARMEVALALTSDVPVFPVLVGGASMPEPQQLLPDLAPLAERNATTVSDTSWRYDADQLVKAIRGRRRWPKLAAAAALLVCVGVVAAVALISDSDSPPRVGKVVGRPIAVEGRPTAIATGAGGVWVTTRLGKVTRIDPSTGRAKSVARVGPLPAGVAVGDGLVWVTGLHDHSLRRIDPRTTRVVGDPIDIGRLPRDVAVGEGAVWTANKHDNTVSRVDFGTGEVRTIRVGKAPVDVAVGAGSVWTANFGDGTLSRISPASGRVVPPAIFVGQHPESVAVGAGAVWVGRIDNDTVTKIDPSTNEWVGEPIQVGERPDDIAIWDGAVYVVNQAAHTLMRIDSASRKVVGEPLRVGNFPDAIAAGGDSLWIANDGARTVVRVRR
jgi:streptogramin lyase